jgi:integral membrane protein
MLQSLMSVKFHLRFSAIAEGLSFLLLLFVAMPLKYMADMPEFVRYTGMTHGALVIWYTYSVIWARGASKLTTMQAVWAIIASLLPFGTFYIDNKVFKKII